MIALDASALLAFLFREAGHERVAEEINGACISAVNLSEVLGRFARDGFNPIDALKRIRQTSIAIVPFDEDQAALAAVLIPAVRPKVLSMGDRACLALAVSRGMPALTADRAWAGLNLGIEIRVIR